SRASGSVRILQGRAGTLPQIVGVVVAGAAKLASAGFGGTHSRSRGAVDSYTRFAEPLAENAGPGGDSARQRFPAAYGAGNGRIFLRDSGFCFGAATDCGGHHRAVRAVRCAAEYSASRGVDYVVGLSQLVGARTT